MDFLEGNEEGAGVDQNESERPRQPVETGQLSEAQVKELELFKQKLDSSNLSLEQKRFKLNQLTNRFLSRHKDAVLKGEGLKREVIHDYDPIPDNEVVMVHSGPDQVAEWLVNNTRQLKEVIKARGGKPPVIIFDNLTPDELALAKLPDGLRREEFKRLNIVPGQAFRINHMARIADQFRNGLMVEGLGRVEVKMISPDHSGKGDERGLAVAREEEINKISASNPDASKIILVDPKDSQHRLESRLMDPERGLDVANIVFAPNPRFESSMAIAA